MNENVKSNTIGRKLTEQVQIKEENTHRCWEVIWMIQWIQRSKSSSNACRIIWLSDLISDMHILVVIMTLMNKPQYVRVTIQVALQGSWSFIRLLRLSPSCTHLGNLHSASTRKLKFMLNSLSVGGLRCPRGEVNNGCTGSSCHLAVRCLSEQMEESLELRDTVHYWLTQQRGLHMKYFVFWHDIIK